MRGWLRVLASVVDRKTLFRLRGIHKRISASCASPNHVGLSTGLLFLGAQERSNFIAFIVHLQLELESLE